tara:strand:+ start:6754 stop:7122 length:369 start_codon:yes stop_codon:yes gene_type:complete
LDLYKVKIKASSMPQVVTAMALLGIIISIAMLVFGNVLHQSTSLEDKRIAMLMDAEINRVIESRDYSENTIDYDDFIIEVEISDHISNQNLKVIYFSAFAANKEVAFLEKRILLNINAEDEE